MSHLPPVRTNASAPDDDALSIAPPSFEVPVGPVLDRGGRGGGGRRKRSLESDAGAAPHLAAVEDVVEEAELTESELAVRVPIRHQPTAVDGEQEVKTGIAAAKTPEELIAIGRVHQEEEPESSVSVAVCPVDANEVGGVRSPSAMMSQAEAVPRAA